MKSGSFFTGVLVTLLLLLVAALVFIHAGRFDVTATKSHAPPVAWALRTITVQGVRQAAEQVDVPAGVDFSDPAFSDPVAGHYDQMCRLCHGGPGAPPEDWVALYPPPPNFENPEEMHAHWTDREIFWIVKHGIKDSGMSAFGLHADDEELWRLAAFVRRIPQLNPEEYSALVQQHAGHGH